MSGRIAALAVGLCAWAIWIALRPPAPKYPAQTGAMMARLDANGDGRLDAQEYARLGQPGVPLAIFDADGSGALELVELEVMLLGVDPAWMAAQAR